MSSIRIDLSTVEQLRSKHSRLSSGLSNAANQLSSLSNGMDPAIKARRQLHYRISYATQRLRGLEDRMYRISDFMRIALEQYDSTEGQIKGKIGDIVGRHRRSWLENLFDGIGGAYNALSEWLASEDGQRFTELAKANAAAKAKSIPSPEEPIDYRQFVGSHYWDNTKDGSFLYYENYDGSQKLTDLVKASALLTEYESGLGVDYPEATIFDPYICDITDFFIYTIHKGYDPRTFEPLNAQELGNIENYINGRKMAYEIHRQKARAWESIVLDMTPFVGQVKGLVDLAFGEDTVTGREYDNWDYGLGTAGTVFSAVKGGGKLYDLFIGANKLDDIAENFDKIKILNKETGQAGRYSGNLEVVNKPDAAADALAGRIGGQSRVKFSNDPANREFDAISDQYVAQSKPALQTVNKSVRDQMKATFEAAQETGRKVYYHFEGQPAQSVIDKLNEYSGRYGIEVVIDTKPLK